MSITANLVGLPTALKQLISLLALKTLSQPDFDFIAANATPGMVYGWELRDEVERLTGREVPYVYVRESQKKGGQKERITGDSNNLLIRQGQRAVIVESEENPDTFLTKVHASAEALTEAGYKPTQVATIVQPSNEVTRHLQELNLALSYSLTMDDFRDVAIGGPRRTMQPQQIPYELADPIEIATKIIEAGALEIHDIDSGEKPFLYSSGNWGPGYLMVKGLVGQPHLMKYLCAQVALKVPEERVDFVVGNVTGGLIPAWEIRNNLERLKGVEVPFVYVEGSRIFSEGRMVGEDDNPLIHKGDRSLTVEELVNFAQTTTNSALLSRHRGYGADLAATILHYMNPVALKQLQENGLELIYVVSLRPHILDAAERSPMFKPRAVVDYRRFLENPLKWQADRGYVPVREGGTR